MTDALGKKIEIGDLLLNFFTWRSAGIHIRFLVAIGFTDTKIIVSPNNCTSPKSVLSKNRYTVYPCYTVIANDIENAKLSIEDERYIIDVLERTKIKPIYFNLDKLISQDNKNLEYI